MKCVIVALALLCSAQALKMEKPMRSLKDHMDRQDKKHGRPLRTEQKKADTQMSESQGSIVMADGVYDFAASHGLETLLTNCHANHVMDYDVTLCAGEALANDAGLDTEWCGMIWNYFTDAEYMLGQMAEIIDTEQNTASKMVTALEASYKGKPAGPVSEKKAFSAAAVIVDSALEYWSTISTGVDLIEEAQDLIDGYEYCEDTISLLMAEALDAGGLHTRYGLASYDAEEANEEIADKDFGGWNEGKIGKKFVDSYNAAHKEGDAAGPHYKLSISRLRATKQARKNWQLAKEGKFQRKGRTPLTW
jgi:hypothetical protein